ncbi:MAG: glycosyltransferase family 4 protein [Thermodesulfobacteriota bacterium]|nr:glycosyltransferase family 4 protein [Thermodesulfobacteriota bacterium]
MYKLVAFPNDPIYKYYEKGEIKPRYYNPGNLFHEVHLVSLCKQDIEAKKVQMLAGDAQLVIHSIGRPSIFSLPLFLLKVLNIVRQIQPSVIRGYGVWQAGSLATYAGKKLKIPTVVSLHTEPDEVRKNNKAFRYKLAKILECYSLHNTNAVICVSKHVEQFARRHGAKRTVVIYNKVYSDQFSREIKKKENRPTILSVMRLELPKNPDYLIRGIKGLGVNLLIIGQGELEENLKNLVKELGLKEKVEFIRTVPNTEIHSYYQSADIFAISTQFEGFCIPVLEAMAAGLPIVASNTDPIPEILEGTGMIVERNPEAFHTAFKKLLGDPELCKSMGKKAMARARDLDGTIMEQKEYRLYKEFL